MVKRASAPRALSRDVSRRVSRRARFHAEPCFISGSVKASPLLPKKRQDTITRVLWLWGGGVGGQGERRNSPAPPFLRCTGITGRTGVGTSMSNGLITTVRPCLQHLT